MLARHVKMLAYQVVLSILVLLFAAKRTCAFGSGRCADLHIAIQQAPHSEAVFTAYQCLAGIGAEWVGQNAGLLQETYLRNGSYLGNGFAVLHGRIQTSKPICERAFLALLKNADVSRHLATQLWRCMPEAFPAGWPAARFSQSVVFFRVPPCVHLTLPNSPAWIQEPKDGDIGRFGEMLVAWTAPLCHAQHNFITNTHHPLKSFWRNGGSEFPSAEAGDVELSLDGYTWYIEVKTTYKLAPRYFTLRRNEVADAEHLRGDYLLAAVYCCVNDVNIHHDMVVMYLRDPVGLAEQGLLTRMPADEENGSVTFHYNFPTMW